MCLYQKRYADNPHHFRSDKLCFLDHLFAHHWRFNDNIFKDSQPDENGLERRLPGGAVDYYDGTIPSYCKSGRKLGLDIKDVYAPLNYNNEHWIAMWIHIPKRHIVIFDRIFTCLSDQVINEIMEHFLHMIPYLLVECAPNDVERTEYSLEPFTYERAADLPQARSSDCRVYALKYIECYDLGMPFNKKDFAKTKAKAVRDKMAVEIYEEFRDAHMYDNKDGDTFYGAYD